MSQLHLTSLVLQGDDPSSCEYLFKGNKATPYVVIAFSAAPGLTAATFQTGLKQEQANVQPVTGLGDSAATFGTSGEKGLSFLSGTTACSILVLVLTTTSADEIALAKAILNG